LAANGGSFHRFSAGSKYRGSAYGRGGTLLGALFNSDKEPLHLFSASTITFGNLRDRTVCLLPFAMVEMSTAPITNVSLSTWISILYLAIPSSTIAYLLWNHLLKGVEVTKLAVSLYAIPIPTAVFRIYFWRSDYVLHGRWRNFLWCWVSFSPNLASDKSQLRHDDFLRTEINSRSI